MYRAYVCHSTFCIEYTYVLVLYMYMHMAVREYSVKDFEYNVIMAGLCSDTMCAYRFSWVWNALEKEEIDIVEILLTT